MEREAVVAEAMPSRTFYSRVVGVTFKNPDGRPRQKIITRCSEGDKLVAVREPDNKHDPNAIAVCRQNGQQIGYLDRGLARDIAPDMDEGLPLDIMITDITSGGWFSDKSYGVNIEITKYHWE